MTDGLRFGAVPSPMPPGDTRMPYRLLAPYDLSVAVTLFVPSPMIHNQKASTPRVVSSPIVVTHESAETWDFLTSLYWAVAVLYRTVSNPIRHFRVPALLTMVLAPLYSNSRRF